MDTIVSVECIETATKLPEKVEHILNNTRRIIQGTEVTDGKPYMVYLKMPRSNKKLANYRNWLCGGVILHEEYILTSAACIQDAQHFYVVSGTYRYSEDDDRFSSSCIKNGAKKATWKCIPKNYVFDGHENDNIRWMNNDIAIVKIEEGFDFTRRVRGCEFTPRPISFNNQSHAMENPGLFGQIAGWGTTSKYNDWVNRRTYNQQTLLEANVEIISKARCKRRWGARYHNIIENYMICTKDIGQSMSEMCNEKYVDCEDIDYSEEDMRRKDINLRTGKVPANFTMHSAMHNETLSNDPVDRRGFANGRLEGGFCENDHGGPLVYGTGSNAIVIGVISACLVKENSNKCYGPFLYTSVFKNRQFISCAIYKEIDQKCRRQFRSGVTHEEQYFSWKDHPDGPAKNELTEEISNTGTSNVKFQDIDDKVFPKKGFIMRSANETVIVSSNKSN
ncbi:PREDICTED: uncharacterized protein LOC106106105 [Papilio polytes]|uniref:uncharacterized protein LOC106106105 n=1 Tax=Papilio polytes TaxID=76194 RepID=UPI000675BF48|nr:PREDICTED: uncharacterized protein LOC106106105 [Papilio polytes]